jgi:cyclohexa-1,5-dienecarbonyl-CoA hydratase
MSCVHVTVERGLARVEMERPPLNVIDMAFAPELAAAIEGVAARDDVAVIALAARGRAFCAGVDVRDHLPDRGADMLRAFHRVCIALLEAPPPTVAIVDGAALGGGCELTLCCDLVVASERATFGLPEIRLGAFPPVAAVALPRMIPAHHAAAMLLQGGVIAAGEAERLGLVNRVAAVGALEAAAGETLGGFLELSPASLRLAKQAARGSGAWPTAREIAAAERSYVGAPHGDSRRRRGPARLPREAAAALGPPGRLRDVNQARSRRGALSGAGTRRCSGT